MNEFVCIHDKAEIETFLRRNVELHLYELGDLDEFFWPKTIWYGLKEDGLLSAMCLMYVGQSQPTLLALGEPRPLTELIKSISHLLPSWFYSHLSPGVEAGFVEKFRLESHGKHLKMILKKPEYLGTAEVAKVARLGPEHLAEVLQLYKESYPGNWFDPRMLETGEYFGVRENARLVSIAGIHVYSPLLRVAVLGNITTAIAQRKRGLASMTTRALCRSLLKKVDHIGLNVGAENRFAISCYEKLGFEVVAPYQEFLIERKAAHC